MLQSITTVRQLQEQVKTLRQSNAEWQTKHGDARSEVGALRRENKTLKGE